MKQKVFLSWSGSISKQIATILHKWLPSVLQNIDPWLSSEDIKVGRPWYSDLKKELRNINIGIICLNEENLESSWVHFEAGAIANALDGHVCPYLFEISPSHLPGPLKQFQACRSNNKEDTIKLLKLLNEKLGEDGITDENLIEQFSLRWSQLQKKLNVISNKQKKLPKEKKPKKEDRQILEEVLDVLWTQSKSIDLIRRGNDKKLGSVENIIELNKSMTDKLTSDIDRYHTIISDVNEKLIVNLEEALDQRDKALSNVVSRKRKRLFQYRDLYPVIVDEDNNPYLDKNLFLRGIKHFLNNEYNQLAVSDLIYLKEDNFLDLGEFLGDAEVLLYEELTEKYHLSSFIEDFNDENEKIFENYKRIVTDIGLTLPGMQMEILLHDIRNPLRSIICIMNSDQVSGREPYHHSTNFVLKFLDYCARTFSRGPKSRSKVSYLKLLEGGGDIKATSIPLYDQKYGLIGIICININVGSINSMNSATKKQFFENYTKLIRRKKTNEVLEDHRVTARRLGESQ